MTFDKIIIIRGVVKTSALNNYPSREAHIFWPKKMDTGMCC